MSIVDTYSSISAPAEGLYKELGSRFISLAFPVESEAQVKEIVDGIKRKYHDARHCCFAFRLGQDARIARSNDDGEPSGSAGKPILGRLVSEDLSDILVVVVRYFGGVKLGIPGLTRAYREAASDALSKAARCEKITGEWYSLSFPCACLPFVMGLCKELELRQREQDFGQDCRMEVWTRLKNRDIFLEKIQKSANFKFININRQ